MSEQTTTYEVHLLAFEDDMIRPVEVPFEDEAKAMNHNAILDLIFRYGQNDFQRLPIRIVSVGDVIDYFGRFFMVRPVGFAEISLKEFNEYKEIPIRNRPWSLLARGE